MVEMWVRGVRRSPERGRAVVVLARRGDGPAAELEVLVDAAEGHALMHELRSQSTLRSHSLSLMARLLAHLDGRLVAVEIIPGDDQKPAGRLRLVGPKGESAVPLCLGQALGLAVTRRLPLLVSEALLATSAADRPEESPAEIPEVFLRAFVE